MSEPSIWEDVRVVFMIGVFILNALALMNVPNVHASALIGLAVLNLLLGFVYLVNVANRE